MRHYLHATLAFTLALVAWNQGSTVWAADWLQFRGPGGSGIAEEKSAPVEWGPDKNILWRAELPDPGNSSPVVSAGKVFITVAAEEGRRRSLLCFDRKTGEQLWERTVEYDKEEPTHKTNPYAGSSPACDGERVVVWHSSAGMYCYDYSGNLLWNVDLGEFIHIWGYGASPIFYQDLVINNCGPGERTFLIALDKRTGKEVWRTNEEGGDSGLGEGRRKWIGSWSTPIIAKIDGRDQLVVSFPRHVKSYDPRTGQMIWECAGLGDLVYTSAVVGDDVIVAMGGYHGPAIGLKPGGQGNITEKAQLWRQDRRNPQRIGSGVIIDGLMYMANTDGTVECLDPRTGEQKWKDRLSGGSLWGSIVAVGDNLYVTSQRGDTVVFKANPEKLEEIAVNSLRENSNSTIAVSDGQIFLRTFKALYCIGEK